MNAYTFARSTHGDLFAETVIPLGTDRRELRIDTRKGFRGLRTSATVVQVNEDGRSYTHAIGARMTGDFSERIEECNRSVRATEKTIRAMHERARLQADEIMTRARAWYAEQAARREAQAS